MHKGSGSVLKSRWNMMLLWIGLLACVVQGAEQEHIRLGSDPVLSADGSMLAFAWRGDIWVVPSEGGIARQVTQHPAGDRQPVFSPDGSEIAFISDRDAGSQVYVKQATDVSHGRIYTRTMVSVGRGAAGQRRAGSLLAEFTAFLQDFPKRAQGRGIALRCLWRGRCAIARW